MISTPPRRRQVPPRGEPPASSEARCGRRRGGSRAARIAAFAALAMATAGCLGGGPSEAAALEIEVVASYPHDVQAFTQGLLFHEGFLYESTGGYGKSSLR
jgi:hypothetical protein